LRRSSVTLRDYENGFIDSFFQPRSTRRSGGAYHLLDQGTPDVMQVLIDYRA
jgi:hypothetical protein